MASLDACPVVPGLLQPLLYALDSSSPIAAAVKPGAKVAASPTAGTAATRLTALPNLGKLPEPFSATSPQRRDIECVIWLALFAASKLSPSYSANADDAALDIGAASFRQNASSPFLNLTQGQASPTLASGSAASPIGNRSPTPPSAFSPRQTPPPQFDLESVSVMPADDLMSQTTSTIPDGTGASRVSITGESFLPFTFAMCSRAFRGILCMLRLNKSQVGFTVEQLLKWATSPQIFGPDKKKREQVYALPPAARVRRDRVYRTFIEVCLRDVHTLYFVWWCCGMYRDVYRLASSAPPQFPFLSSRDELDLATLRNTPPYGAEWTSCECDMALVREKRSSAIPSIADMLRSLLWVYVEGALDLNEELRSGSLASSATATKSCFQYGCAFPKLVQPVLSALRHASITNLILTSCGLLTVDGIEELRSLTTLRLSQNRLRSVSLLLLSNLTALLSLALDGNLLEELWPWEPCCASFASPSSSPFVPSLSTTSAIPQRDDCSDSLSDGTTAILVAPSQLLSTGSTVPRVVAPSLRVLNLADNLLTSDAVGALFFDESVCCAQASLIDLDLSGNVGIDALPAPHEIAARFPALEKVVLTGVNQLPLSFVETVRGQPRTARPRYVLPCIPVAAAFHQYPPISRLVPRREIQGQRRRGPRLRRTVSHMLLVLFLYRLVCQVATRKILSTVFQNTEEHPTVVESSRSATEQMPAEQNEVAPSVPSPTPTKSASARELRELRDKVLRPTHAVTHFLSTAGLPTQARRATLSEESERMLMRYASKNRIARRLPPKATHTAAATL